MILRLVFSLAALAGGAFILWSSIETTGLGDVARAFLGWML